jgi:hypothetical protein
MAPVRMLRFFTRNKHRHHQRNQGLDSLARCLPAAVVDEDEEVVFGLTYTQHTVTGLEAMLYATDYDTSHRRLIEMLPSPSVIACTKLELWNRLEYFEFDLEKQITRLQEQVDSLKEQLKQMSLKTEKKSELELKIAVIVAHQLERSDLYLLMTTLYDYRRNPETHQLVLRD